MLKVSIGLAHRKMKKNQSIQANNLAQEFRETRLTSCFKFIKCSLSRERAHGFIPLKAHQTYRGSSFYRKHKKSITQPSQYSESKSFNFLHTLRTSQQKPSKTDLKPTKKRKLLSKIIMALDHSQCQKTKMEQQLLSRQTIKKHSFNLSIFSERQSHIQKQSFYNTKQHYKQDLSKLSSQRQIGPNSSLGEALVVKKYRSKQPISKLVYK